MSPEMEQGIQIAKSEIPDLAPVQPYGFFSRMFQPNSMAYTSPGKSIYLNPSVLQGQSPQDIADTIVHEQEHVKQMRGRGLNPLMELAQSFSDIGGEPYHRRPDEMEAYRAEMMRRQRMRRTQTAIPEFTSGEFYTPRDIRLPSPKINTAPSSNTLSKIQRGGG